MEWFEKVKSFALQSIRVWRILKKPSMEEFSTIAKVSALGVLLIGAIGFLIVTIVRMFA